MKPRTYISLTLESLSSTRTVTIKSLGSFPATMIQEFQNRGQRSRLWRDITAIVDSQYQNDRLVEIRASGGLSQEWAADYCAPTPRRPAVVGYGPCAGILSTEVWA